MHFKNIKTTKFVNPKNIIFTIILLKPILNAVLSNKIDKKTASEVLNSSSSQRFKRSNDGNHEEEKLPDYQRECVEEECGYLEIQEIIKNEEWPGRNELFKKMYNPAYIGDKTKTNINVPVYSLNDNKDEFIKQAIKDLNNILHRGCDYYHPMQKEFYSKNYFAVDEDIRLCDEYSACNQTKKTKECRCAESQGLYIRKGKYCEECHENCYLYGGTCKVNKQKSEYFCQCPKLTIITTKGEPISDKTKFFTEHTKSGFCEKPTDYCGNYNSECDKTTQCVSTFSGYECKCRDNLVPDGPYNCKKHICDRDDNPCDSDSTTCDKNGKSPICQCRETDGFKFRSKISNNTTCVENICDSDKNICDENSTTCETDSSKPNKYSCQCLDNFVPDLEDEYRCDHYCDSDKNDCDLTSTTCNKNGKSPICQCRETDGFKFRSKINNNTTCVENICDSVINMCDGNSTICGKDEKGGADVKVLCKCKDGYERIDQFSCMKSKNKFWPQITLGTEFWIILVSSISLVLVFFGISFWYYYYNQKTTSSQKPNDSAPDPGTPCSLKLCSDHQEDIDRQNASDDLTTQKSETEKLISNYDNYDNANNDFASSSFNNQKNLPAKNNSSPSIIPYQNVETTSDVSSLASQRYLPLSETDEVSLNGIRTEVQSLNSPRLLE